MKERFVSGALVDGPAAHLLDRLLWHRDVRRLVESLPRDLLAELAEAHHAIHIAAQAYLARPAEDGSAATLLADIEARSGEELLTSGQAAELIGLSERRVRQLCAQGLGVKVAGRWLVERVMAEVVREDRRGR